MSLPQEPAFSLVKDNFVVGWKNIKDEKYVGSSHGYTCENAAVGTTNGAGPKNTQIFVLSPDGVVLHCLPGFWHPEDLAYELRFAQQVHRLWKDKRRLKDKKKMYARLHDVAIRLQPSAMRARSGWQGFDALNEKNRLKKLKPGQQRDTFYYSDQGKVGRLKPISVLVHERMAERPFKRFRSFDTAVFADYGRPYYDNNARVEGVGVNFGGKAFMASQKRMAKKRAERAARKAKSDAYYGKKKKEESEKKGRSRRAVAKSKKQGKKGRTTSRTTSRPTSRPSRRSKSRKGKKTWSND